ncbi:MAG: type II toxin-antitoxin system HicB family antitoxin [Planctomycetota bacterium]
MGSNILTAPGDLGVAPNAVETLPAVKPRFKWTEYRHNARLRFDVACRTLENGHVLVFATNLPGAMAQERSFKKALRSFRAVLACVLDLHQESGQPIPFEQVELEDGDELCASVEVDV